MKTEQNKLAEKFLLGKLTEDETIKIEENYFKNKTLFEEILIAENNLIDAYVTDSLSSEDQKLFENRLLLNPRQRKRVNFAKTLNNYSSSLPLAKEESNSATGAPFWKSFIPKIISNKPILSLSVTLAAMLIFISGIWLLSDFSTRQNNQTNEVSLIKNPQNRQNQESKIEANSNDKSIESPPEILSSTPLKKEIPRKKKTPQITKETPQTPKTPTIFSLILSSGLTRDAGTTQKFTIPPKTELVRMQLKLEANNFSSYQAVLETVEGNQIWRSKKLKSESKKSVSISVPAKLLKKADYILSLKGLTKDGLYERVEDYTFTIIR
jgi:hypothetical protein